MLGLNDLEQPDSYTVCLPIADMCEDECAYRLTRLEISQMQLRLSVLRNRGDECPVHTDRKGQGPQRGNRRGVGDIELTARADELNSYGLLRWAQANGGPLRQWAEPL